MNRMENVLTLAIQTVIGRINKFNGKDVTWFLEFYEYEMANRGETGVQIVSHINWVCTLDVQERIIELSEKFCEDRAKFRQALLDEYILDDRTGSLKKSFLKWTEKGSNRVFSLIAAERVREKI